MQANLPEEEFDLTYPQYDFVNSEAKFPAFVGGYGSGKTHAGIWRTLMLKLKEPKVNQAYYLPTYDLINLIAFPRFQELFEMLHIPFVLNKSDKMIYIPGNGKIILRTMDKPETIIGYEVGDSLIDELDVLKIDKAADVFRKVLARNRQKKPSGDPNTVGVVTTPEGFRFVYQKWQKNPLKGSELIVAPTSSNYKNLPEDYIQTLQDSYPTNMLQAYLDGKFVNLTQGSVYPEFSRQLNGCFTKPKRGETVHIGIDFNVGNMAAVVHVLRDGDPHAVNEFIDLLDTPAMIAAIKKKYVNVKEPHSIMIYPDASGKSRKSVNATESDIALLREAGFTILARSKNPFVKDRVAAMNKMIHKEGKRRYKVNIDKCPHYVESLEKQAYDKNGEPDKSNGLDHANDGGGYFISYRYPVARGKSSTFKLKGV